MSCIENLKNTNGVRYQAIIFKEKSYTLIPYNSPKITIIPTQDIDT